MKYLSKFIIIINILFLCFNSSLANEKTAVVDVEFLVQNSNIGKKMLKSINDLNQKNIKSLEKKNEDLKNLETQIRNKKNILSEEEFNNEVKNFQQKVEKFTNEKNLKVKEFNEFRNTELKKIFQLINPIITNYMKEKSIDILLDTKNIFLVKKSSNLTEDILKTINNEIK